MMLIDFSLLFGILFGILFDILKLKSRMGYMDKYIDLL